MNKKFFAALASATMAFTASGSIAVFADDFVEENTPAVKPGELLPTGKVKWDKEHFGELAYGQNAVTFTGTDFTLTLDDLVGKEVNTADLAKITKITLNQYWDGEIKGLEYFTGLEEFDDTSAKNIKNETLDFSANTKLESLTVTHAPELAKITLPEADEDEVYHLNTLTLTAPKLTALDLAKQEKLVTLKLTNSQLKSLDLSALERLTTVEVTGNSLLKNVVVINGKKGEPTEYTKLDLQNNALETINLDNVKVGTLNLQDNHIGALDLSKTTVTSPTLGNQTFYVSELAKNVNLEEAISGLKATRVKDATNYDEETGVLTLDTDGETEYKYDTKKGELTVKLTAANPMNRLYNPNSGEHFYTADIKEKEALVKLGWNDEGYGWVAPTEKAGQNNPVYRLYNPNAGDHHYTMDEKEAKTLVAYGWKDEGKGWYSAGAVNAAPTAGQTVAVYRQYNPYANGAGSHNYTTDKAENDYLVSLGWTPEGTAWLALK